MANPIYIDVTTNPDVLLNTGMYAAGAVIRVQSATSSTGTFADIAGTPTATIVTATWSYTLYDPAGTSSTWYRTRYENSGGSRTSDWSTPFPAVGTTNTATASYATVQGVKLRLGLTPSQTADDGLIQRYCDQVNSRIEGITGRILGPIPTFSTTTSGALSAGATSISLASAAGLAVGDALLIGPVTGTREHVTVGAISGTTVTPESPVVNAYGSGATAVRCFIFDGYLEGTLVMPVPIGIVSLSSLEVAPTWNAASTNWALIPSTDRLLRPSSLDREPGWPATEIHLSPIPSVGNTYPYFASYDAIARAVGTFGWPAIPDEITDCAETVAVRAYQARRTGQSDSQGTTDTGVTLISRILAAEWRDVLNRYKSKDVVIIG